MWNFKLETLYSFVSFLIKAYKHCFFKIGLTIKFFIRSEKGRCGGLMVRVFDSRSSGPGSGLGQDT